MRYKPQFLKVNEFRVAQLVRMLQNLDRQTAKSDAREAREAKLGQMFESKAPLPPQTSPEK